VIIVRTGVFANVFVEAGPESLDGVQRKLLRAVPRTEYLRELDVIVLHAAEDGFSGGGLEMDLADLGKTRLEL
jgi:hypothetical protein